MNERIKKLRKSLGLTQQEFSDRIKVKRNTVATYEMGRSMPSDAAISLICREFNVNETWLRTGDGEMFKPVNRDQEIADFMADILKGEPDFRTKLISVMARLSAAEWAMLERRARELAATLAETPEADEPDPDISDLL